jgi:phosphoribosylaminoimidazole carboxylase (NCAIR synthetase)
VPRRKLLAQLTEHGGSARALLGPEDVLLEPAATQHAKIGGLLGRAWCPTPLALASMRALGVEPEPHPEPAVLRRVNHRLFAHELGGGLPEQQYVQSREQLLAHLADYGRHWLLKRPLGFAGRGQLRAIGPLTDKQWTWVEASLERDGLLIEPLVVPTLEVSLHGFIWRDGRGELGRICTQNVSERGAFRDVRLALPGELSPA